MIILNTHGDTLHATVKGAFDFNTAQDLVRECKPHLRAKDITRVEVTLEQVTHCNSCAIGAMLVLSEWVHGDFRLNLQDCHADVHQLFDSGLLDRYFGGNCPTTGYSAPTPACARCLDGKCRQDASHPKPGCPLRSLMEPLLPKFSPT